MTDKKQPSIDWSRIYVLPYLPSFKENVKSVRTLLKLPESGILDAQQASLWLHNHLGLKKPYSPDSPTIPLAAAIIQSNLETKLLDTEVPLWHFALVLAQKFRVPLRMRNHIGLYILTDDEEWIYVWNGLDVVLSANAKAGQAQVAVTVDGINASTTKGQWDDVWYNYVKPLRPRLGQVPENNKNAPGPALRERIKRYAEWYELSEVQKLGPAKAFRKWAEDHKEYSRYSENALLKGVNQFKRLIARISKVK